MIASRWLLAITALVLMALVVLASRVAGNADPDLGGPIAVTPSETVSSTGSSAPDTQGARTVTNPPPPSIDNDDDPGDDDTDDGAPDADDGPGDG